MGGHTPSDARRRSCTSRPRPRRYAKGRQLADGSRSVSGRVASARGSQDCVQNPCGTPLSRSLDRLRRVVGVVQRAQLARSRHFESLAARGTRRVQVGVARVGVRGTQRPGQARVLEPRWRRRLPLFVPPTFLVDGAAKEGRGRPSGAACFAARTPGPHRRSRAARGDRRSRCALSGSETLKPALTPRPSRRGEDTETEPT